jgi:phage terminase large subunit GpA-like protein
MSTAIHDRDLLIRQETAAFFRARRREPRFWTSRPTITVSQYAETKRVLPPGTPFPGPWQNSRTPYLTEPMDNMSPSSPIEWTVIAKGAQLGFTASAENVVAFWMDSCPAEMLFISGSEGLLDRWTKRLEPLIDSCGIRKKLGAQNAKTAKHRSGDKMFCKEYPGGSLDLGSAQSPGAIAADSKRVLLRDEMDRSPRTLRSGEGNWAAVSYARTNAWGSRRKVYDFSTPTTYEESVIWPEYLRGDCRKYSIPCPHCGGFQFLVWDGGTNGAGIKWRVETVESAAEKSAAGNGTTAGHVAEVWYQCEHCGGAIKNHDKATMLPAGEWQPTAISESPTLRSYHLSSLYSPVGMLSWEGLVAAYLEAQSTQDGMRSFVNLYLGEPYREQGQRPNVERVIDLRGGYRAGTIPSPEVLFLTMAVDVQQGSSKDPVGNPPRLEVEVCGHGAGYRSWSIQYFRIPGAIGNPYDGAWAELNKMALDGALKFSRADGRVFVPVLTLIDSGDGTNIDTVYHFAQSWRNTYACAGTDLLKKKADRPENAGSADEMGKQNFDRYRVTRQRNDTPVIFVSGNFYKHLIYRSLAIKHNPTGEQAPGFCSFPADYPRGYFEMLTAEEKRNDGSFYCPSGRRNEALDLRVYNLAARDFYIDLKIQEIREAYQAKGATKAQLLEIRSPAVLQMLANATRPIGTVRAAS